MNITRKASYVMLIVALAFILQRSMGRENDERSETFARPHAEPMIQRSMGRENDERSETFGRPHAKPIISTLALIGWMRLGG